MRTTVELTPEHRSRLLAIAARRGEKGFSSVLAEAVQMYLETESDRQRRQEAVRALIGALSPDDAESMRRMVDTLRGTWR